MALGQATNNVGELAAIGLALELLDEAGVPPEHPVAAYSDSSYARGVLTQGWKAKANQARIAQIREALKARPGLALHWVAGHVGIDGNERADQLANMGAAGITTRRRVDAGPLR
jgi:ribonuclease HI